MKTGGCRKHLYFEHPSELPTQKELDYLNQGKNQTTICQHLQQLVDAGIPEEVFFSEGRRQNNLPYNFYGITRVVDNSSKSTSFREIYDRVEKTDDIERYETAPQPER